MKSENPLPAATVPGTIKHRVFVVDDHPLMRQSLVEAIKREADLEVCGEAADVAEALRSILELRPDLVLTDIQLKTSSGLQLIESLQTHSQKPVIVATTMFDVRRNERLARAAGANGFASKHDGPEKLVAELKRALRVGEV